MTEKISLEELTNLPLEERARTVLRCYDKDIKIGGGSPLSFIYLFEAVKYLEKNYYMIVVHGNSKTDCIITDDGHAFMKKD